jgi:hypothetical protein
MIQMTKRLFSAVEQEKHVFRGSASANMVIIYPIYAFSVLLRALVSQ